MIYDFKFSDENRTELILESGAEFENCEFLGLPFSGSSLKAMRFADCVFKNCNLANQDLTNATFTEIQFESCNLMGINWCNLKRVDGLTFRNCKLNFSSFQALKLKKIKVEDCQAIDVDFSDADLTEGVFSGSALAGTNFNRANLTNCDFRRAKDFLFDLRVAKLKGLKLSLADAPPLLSVLGIEITY
jgi:fluoroquinolone resistance protein